MRLDKLARASLLLAGVPVIAFTAFALHHNPAAAMMPDTPSYMYFGESRPVGYPLFLALVKAVAGHYAAAPIIQLAVLCAAFGYLAWSFWSLTRSLWLSVAFEVLLFANPGPMLLTGQLVSDSLSAACVAVFAAVVLEMVRAPKLWRVLTLVAIGAGAFTLRPVNVALIAASLAAIIAFGRNLPRPRPAQGAILLLGAFVAQELTPAVHWLRQDHAESATPLARGLLQKTLFKQWPRADPAAAGCDAQLIGADTRAANEYLARVPPSIRAQLLQPYSDFLRFAVILPHMRREHHVASLAALDPILMCYSLARFRDDPLYFLGDAAQQTWRLLTYPTFVSRRQHDEIERYLTAHPPVLPAAVPREDPDYLQRAQTIAELHLDAQLLDDSELHRLQAPTARPQLLAYALRVFQIAGAVLMALALVPLASRMLRNSTEALLPAIGVLGVAFYGEVLITAFVEFALPRYVYPLWPLFCSAFALLAEFARRSRNHTVMP